MHIGSLFMAVIASSSILVNPVTAIPSHILDKRNNELTGPSVPLRGAACPDAVSFKESQIRNQAKDALKYYNNGQEGDFPKPFNNHEGFEFWNPNCNSPDVRLQEFPLFKGIDTWHNKGYNNPGRYRVIFMPVHNSERNVNRDADAQVCGVIYHYNRRDFTNCPRA